METETLKQTKRHFSKLGLMYFLGAIIISVIQFVVILFAGNLNPALLSNANAYMVLAMLPVYIISMPLMILLIRTVPAAQIEKKKLTVGQLIKTIIMSLTLIYLGNIVGTIITQIIGLIKGSGVNNVLNNFLAGTTILPTFLIAVILAPIFEELLFRKLLIDRTVAYGEGISVLLSGLMFGLFHGNLNQFTYAFLLGLFFGFIYVKTGNILYTIVPHMVVNFFGSILAPIIFSNVGLEYFTTTLSEAEMIERVMQRLPQLLGFMLYFLVYFALIVTGIVFWIINAKKLTCNPGTNSIPQGKRFSTIILNVGMILYCLYWIITIIYQLLM